MQLTRKCLVLSLLSVLVFCGALSAQLDGRIESMKLLTAGTGWAATRNKLFWTSDNGTTWKDITPKLNHRRQTVSSVFFLDSSTGLVLMHCSDDRDPLADDVCFEFALTANAGEDWSIVHPKIVDPVPPSVIIEDEQGFSSSSFIAFADPQHGWAILVRNLPVGRSSGAMLRTVDGGRTWTQLPKWTVAGSLRFTSAKDGWLTGGPDHGLYVTDDAGDTWNRVVLPPPPGVKVEAWPPKENAVWPSYELPVFEGLRHGFLIGSYWDGSRSTLVLFSTQDLGRTWKFERVLPNAGGVTSISGNTLFMASTPPGLKHLTITCVSLGGTPSRATAVAAELHGVPVTHYLTRAYDALDMIDSSDGWLLSEGLLSTSDGGFSWSEIAPASVFCLPQPRREGPKLAAPKRQASGSAPPAASNVSAHLGFDISNVPIVPSSIALEPGRSGRELITMGTWPATMRSRTWATSASCTRITWFSRHFSVRRRCTTRMVPA